MRVPAVQLYGNRCGQASRCNLIRESQPLVFAVYHNNRHPDMVAGLADTQAVSPVSENRTTRVVNHQPPPVDEPAILGWIERIFLQATLSTPHYPLRLIPLREVSATYPLTQVH